MSVATKKNNSCLVATRSSLNFIIIIIVLVSYWAQRAKPYKMINKRKANRNPISQFIIVCVYMLEAYNDIH